MSDKDSVTDEDNRAEENRAEENPDDGLAPEVPTTFATKGVGWSGREKDDLQIIESDTPARPHTFRRSRPPGG